MKSFAVLGVLIVFFMILAAVTFYRARKRAEMVGMSPEKIQAQKAEQRARREEKRFDDPPVQY